ncbi:MULTISPECIES: hypothetical protein [Streptomyces]|uniref:Uncharacterized protein n=1 Tax=Streptomyces silvae TaxID=2803812 RepID=A0ABU8A955_9ACTN|nr:MULTISPECIES: hypothetical protein [unclassified Streptomyces]MDX3326790.1 hypothetical protein [Streptomyces sp. ME02-6979-3A]MDX3683200.1 hypothetical protein [Streptomyces sp. AK04-4c]WSS71423.1 hypothetical protein OG491_25460 [Streptomyces sp. NBC_01175]
MPRSSSGWSRRSTAVAARYAAAALIAAWPGADPAQEAVDQV